MQSDQRFTRYTEQDDDEGVTMEWYAPNPRVRRSDTVFAVENNLSNVPIPVLYISDRDEWLESTDRESAIYPSELLDIVSFALHKDFIDLDSLQKVVTHARMAKRHHTSNTAVGKQVTNDKTTDKN